MFDFFKNYKDDPKMYRAALYTRYSAARMNLLLVVIFTTINIITLVTGAGGFFFTAAIPYQIVNFGMIVCGMSTQEFYDKTGIQPIWDKSYIAIFIIIALLIVTLYLLCWLFSKKRGADKWLGFALALMSADMMVGLLMGTFGIWLVDLIFHLLIIVLLFSGIGAYKKLKALPRDEEPVEEYPESEEQDTGTDINSTENEEKNALSDENGADENEG